LFALTYLSKASGQATIEIIITRKPTGLINKSHPLGPESGGLGKISPQGLKNKADISQVTLTKADISRVQNMKEWAN
jgi:hypothetical protein